MQIARAHKASSSAYVPQSAAPATPAPSRPPVDQLQRTAPRAPSPRPNTPLQAAFEAPTKLKSAAEPIESAIANILVVPSGNPVEDKKLLAAIKWLGERYPRLLPQKRTTVEVKRPFGGSSGLTNPFTGAIYLLPGMKPEVLTGTLAHEMLHSRVGSSAALMGQGVNSLMHGDSEHEFLHKVGEAISNHALLEAQLGRIVDNDELLSRSPMWGIVEYEDKGVPTVVVKTAVLPNAHEIEYRLPAWSGVRESFERESNQ